MEVLCVCFFYVSYFPECFCGDVTDLSLHFYVEREGWKYSRRVGENEKSWEKWGILYLGGERKTLIGLLEVSQASPCRPSDKGSMEVKTLAWLEALA
jgi:hypothetical protein